MPLRIMAKRTVRIGDFTYASGQMVDSEVWQHLSSEQRKTFLDLGMVTQQVVAPKILREPAGHEPAHSARQPVAASELLNWYWQVVGDERGVCQCQAEFVIQGCDDPELMRAVLLIAIAIDQAAGDTLGDHYASFRAAFQCPRLEPHGSSYSDRVAPDWVIYDHYHWDERMNWGLGAVVAEAFMSDVQTWLRADPCRAEHWPRLAERLAWLSERFAHYDHEAATAITRALATTL